MKFPLFISVLISFIFLMACGPQKMYVKVEVRDVFTDAALDSAVVSVFKKARGGAEQKLQSCITDLSGTCSLDLTIDEQFSYRIEAGRSHYVEAVSESGGDYMHEAQLEIQDSVSLTLFLETILPPDPERFEKMYPVVPISQVIAAIAADEWSWSFLPKINWQDVPILLKQGQDSTFIHQYPRNLRSRYRPDSIRAGLVSLWLIEALRKQELRSSEDFYSLMPPSRAPVLGTRKGNPSGYNSVEQLMSAFEAYNAWWEEVPVDSSSRMEAIKKNPLAGIGLSWM